MELAGNKLVNSKEFFSSEDLKGLLGWKFQTGFLEITCGCTSTLGFGDFVGSLRITQQGDLSVVCNCLPGACKKGPMAPIIFQKHARNDHKTWKDSIWVTQIFQTSKYSIKVPLCNTVLLRYYYANRRVHHVNFHRDEFLRCSACGKERRFKLRSKEECRTYFCAVKNPNWVCHNFPEIELNCEMEEERGSRKVFRGCPKLINCEGCLSCVCTGCGLCMSA